MTDVFRLNRRMDSFEVFKASIEGWAWQPVQLSSGPLHLELESVAYDEFTASSMSFQPRIADRSSYDDGLVGLSLALGPVTYCGVEVTQPSLAVLVGGRESRSVFDRDFRCLELAVPESAFAETDLGKALEAGRGLDELVTPLDVGEVAWLREAFSTALSEDAGLVDPVARLALRDRVVAFVGSLASRQIGASRGSRAARPRRALALEALAMIDRLGEETTVADLAGRLGCTPRALQLAFQSVLRTSPAQFLLARRLTRVRERLAANGSSVLGAATEASFGNPSRFARQYARLFGELPSQTLARARASGSHSG